MWTSNFLARNSETLRLCCTCQISRLYHRFEPYREKRQTFDEYFTADGRDYVNKMMRFFGEKDKFRFSFETMQRKVQRKMWAYLKHDQRFNEERHVFLGADLAAAHFIVSHGGAVKFIGDDRWHRQDPRNRHYFLPNTFVDNMHVEAIDASSMPLLYEGLENLVNLKHLRYLNLSNCLFLDDWAMQKLHQFADSLLYLDLSGCPQISEKGLAAVCHLRKLKRLVIKDMKKLHYPELTALMLQESLGEGCFVQGVDCDDTRRLETFRDEDWEKYLLDEYTAEQAKLLRQARASETDNVELASHEDLYNVLPVSEQVLDSQRLSGSDSASRPPPSLNADQSQSSLSAQCPPSQSVSLQQNLQRFAGEIHSNAHAQY